MNWDLILRIGAIVIAALAAIPGIYAIRKQLKMEKLEQRKLILESESISADVAAKLIDSAGDLQEFYAELLKEVKKQLEENKTIICRLEVKIDNITEENIKQGKRIEELEEGVHILSEQIKELGQIPRFPRDKK